MRGSIQKGYIRIADILKLGVMPNITWNCISIKKNIIYDLGG